MRIRLSPILLVLAFATGACFGGDSSADSDSEPDSDAASDIAVDGDGVDDCGQGQAWPDDPDFREAVCHAYGSMTDVLASGNEVKAEWGTRITDAILNYADRDAAMAELVAVRAEMDAAAG